MSLLTEVQVFCDYCNEVYYYQFFLMKPDGEFDIPGVSGLVKKTISHGDHVLVCDIDYNGAVRGSQTLELHYTPMETLTTDIAHSLLYLNNETARPLHIDVYTSDIKLVKFFKSLISKIFEQAVWKSTSSKRIVTSTIGNNTSLYADGVQISVGPSILDDISLKNPLKGLVLDIIEVERTRIEIEATLDLYDWCAVIVPRVKQEGYTNAFTTFFEAKNIPYFINTLSNRTLIELFEFIFAHSLKLIDVDTHYGEEEEDDLPSLLDQIS